MGETSDIAHSVGTATMTIAGLLVSFLLIVPFGPEIEARLFPVVVDHRARFTLVDNELRSVQTFEKKRRCLAWRRLVELVDRNDSRVVDFETPVARVVSGSKTLVSKARLERPVKRPARIEAMIWYRCHGFWLTPYRYPPAIVQ